jgi:hypothetical protein
MSRPWAVVVSAHGRLAKNLLGSGVAQFLHLRGDALAVRRDSRAAVKSWHATEQLAGDPAAGVNNAKHSHDAVVSLYL